MCVCVCACACVSERERGGEREREMWINLPGRRSAWAGQLLLARRTSDLSDIFSIP